MKAERRLADCGGETLSRLVIDEARGSPGAPEARLHGSTETILLSPAEESENPNVKAEFT